MRRWKWVNPFIVIACMLLSSAVKVYKLSTSQLYCDIHDSMLRAALSVWVSMCVTWANGSVMYDVTMSRSTHLTLSSRAPLSDVSRWWLLVSVVSGLWPPHASHWPHSSVSAHSGPNSGLALTELWGRAPLSWEDRCAEDCAEQLKWSNRPPGALLSSGHGIKLRYREQFLQTLHIYTQTRLNAASWLYLSIKSVSCWIQIVWVEAARGAGGCWRLLLPALAQAEAGSS